MYHSRENCYGVQPLIIIKPGLYVGDFSKIKLE